VLSWLLEVEIGGRLFRWAVGEVTLATASGDEVVYRAGLSDPGSLDEGSLGARLAVLDGRVDWPRVAPHAQGGRATLRRALEGDTLEQASVVVAGVVAAVEWDTADAPVVLVIGADSPLLVGAPLPDPFARVGGATWPVSPLSVKCDEGIAYPVLFGVPGWEGTGNPYPCVPIALAQWNGLVAGSHAIISEDPDTGCTSLRLRNTATDEEATQNAVRITDKLGQTVLAADFLASTLGWPGSPTEARQLWAGFGPTGGGGSARTAARAASEGSWARVSASVTGDSPEAGTGTPPDSAGEKVYAADGVPRQRAARWGAPIV
jgi:hypothetical protein